MTIMTTPSLSQPWVLIRSGKGPPALAYLTYQTHHSAKLLYLPT